MSSLRGSATSHENPTLPEDSMFTYRAEMIYKRFTWKCNFAEEWHWVDTLEPVEWTGGMVRQDHGVPPGCNPRFHSPVFPNDEVHRSEDSSITLEGAISVSGFSGSMTSTVAKGVEYTWVNQRAEHRLLCGDRNFMTRDTRVHSVR